MDKTAVFDVEATNWVDFACLGFFDGEEYQVFWSVEGFLEHFLQKKYRGFTCYAHFGGKYDFRFLIPPLIESNKYDLRFMERGSKIMCLKVIDRAKRYTWKFSDSYFLLPASLRELGKNFDIEYMKKDFDPEKCKTIKDWAKPEPQMYLKYDCLGLYEILEKFSGWGLNAGTLKTTLPSQSLHIFKTRFLKEELKVVGEGQENFFRKTYFGGRVEIFKMWGEDLFYYDFNSLYPFVMLEDMPCGDCVAVMRYYPDKVGFYKIRANIPNLLIPPLPVLVDNKLFFPKGEGEFYTTSAELEILVEMGIDFEVIDGLVFDRKEPIFKDYVSYMWKLRTEYPKGTMFNLLAKLCSNSLYGKFGQKRKNTELIFTNNPPDGCLPFDEAFGLYIIEKESKSRYILPYLASYITSLARAKLYRKMREVGFENMWYCDTDSLITSKRLKTGENLGDLKLEYQIKEAVFLQPKAYALKTTDGAEIIKVKGMKDPGINFKTFKKAFETNDVSLIESSYKNIWGFRETLRREKNLILKRGDVVKKLNTAYNKRKVEKELTEPFDFVNL